MSSSSPDSILLDSNGLPLAVQNATTIPTNTSALMVAGSDGYNSRYLTVKAPSTPAVAADPALVVTMSPNSVPQSYTTGSGTIAALNASVVASAGGALTFDITGTWVGTLTTQATNGDGTWINVASLSNQSGLIANSTAINGTLEMNTSGWTQARLTATAWTSGTATVTWSSTSGNHVMIAYQGNGINLQTNTALVDSNQNFIGVTPANTAPTASQEALVVSMSPNSITTITDADTTATGSLGALNNTVTLVMAGEMGAGMQLLAGTLIGTIVAEVSTDGGNSWSSTFFDDPATSNIVSSITFASSNTATTRSIVGAGGASSVRIRVSAYTSGTATCNMRASFTHDPSVLYAGQPGSSIAPPTAAQIAGKDATGKLQVPQVDVILGQTTEQLSTATTITSPNAAKAGIFAFLTPTGSLNVQTPAVSLFQDTFDYSSLDSNRWNSSRTSGSGALTVSNGYMSVGTGTTASSFCTVSSQPAFTILSPNPLLTAMAVKLDTTLTGTVRFWGRGTVPTTPTTSAPLTDAIGFEIDTAGVLRAVIYASGSLVYNQALTGLATWTDGYYHRYVIVNREDVSFWWVDNFEIPTAYVQYVSPNINTLPVLYLMVNQASTLGYTPQFMTLDCAVGSYANDSVALSDGYYPWRKATVKPASSAAIATDQSLVVSLSPNSYVSGSQDSSYFPNPTNVIGAATSLNVDPSGNLAIRGAVTTDELGFRDSFQGSGLTTALTGTLTFVNGSTVVAGTGTTFTTQIVEGQYIKLTSDSETAYAQVFSVISNTSLTLVSGYTGTSSTAASVVSNWATTTGSGATIAVSNSNLTITNGTGSGTTTHVQKLIDYAPLQMFCVTQYTYGTGTGQYAFFGFQDNPASPQAQVIVEIDASLATNQVRFVSSITSAANETINQIFTLPYGMLNTQQLQYKITVTQTSTTLEAATPNTNMSATVATVTTHMPPPYVSMYAVAGITNTAAVTASGVLSTDVIYINNQDRVETALSFTGEPITTVNATDLQPSAVTITAQDTGSTSTALSDGQIFVTGTPTANSFAQYNTISAETIRIQVTGTWTGNLVVEKSLDGGITWVPDNIHLVGTAVITNNFTSNFLGGMNCSGTSLVRVRSTLAWTGTATVKVITSVNVDVVFVGNEQASQLSSNSYPNPVAYISGTDTPTIDAYGNLEIRGPVITDEGSFRDDFSGSALTTTLTGALTFTNGSTTVTGVGTSFTTQVKQMQYIKQSGDAETLYVQVSQVISNTQLLLVANYAGTTTSGATGVISNWLTQTGSGATISVASSVLTIAAGTTASAPTQIRSLGDYGPYSGNFYCQISQRIANQTIYAGFQDTSGTRLAMFQFSGTNNTQATLVSSWSAAEIQATTITLPGGATTASYNTYKVDISMNAVTFSVNGTVVGKNTLHLPGPYDVLFSVMGINNSSPAPASSTSLLCDYFTYEDVDRLQITSSFSGEQLPIHGTIQPLYGANGQALTITIAGLTNGSAQGSTAVSNTTNLYEDVLISVTITSGTTGQLSYGWVGIFAYGSVNGGTTYTEGFGGTNGAATLTAPPNAAIIGQMNVVAPSAVYTYGPVSFCRQAGLDRLPAQWGIFIQNQSGATLASGTVTYQGVNGQIT